MGRLKNQTERVRLKKSRRKKKKKKIAKNEKNCIDANKIEITWKVMLNASHSFTLYIETYCEKCAKHFMHADLRQHKKFFWNILKELQCEGIMKRTNHNWSNGLLFRSIKTIIKYSSLKGKVTILSEFLRYVQIAPYIHSFIICCFRANLFFYAP